MLFAASMSWREPKYHKHILYPNLLSAIKQVPHSVNLPVPTRPAYEEIQIVSEDKFPFSEETDPRYQVKGTSSPYFLTQTYLNYLVRELGLSKQKSELLGSRLQMLHFTAIEKKLYFHIIQLTTH
ncbi:hypothetical protein PR048_020162 [Dryococelus australis]|uniref:Uncharacterized protein n=1 Tax=Dryococelus australis TaxID=614101 RepID=A0ABQ9H5I6_9NEOP|nr:hypothetical protein PR048_020162 [Dryococelus australis]